MFGIGSQQDDMLEEQYRLKYLKYKEKYLKLKQTGGFGKTSSGIHCILTTNDLANEVKSMLERKANLDAITAVLHDKAYVVKDGSNEVELVKKTSLKDKASELGNKMKFWDKTKPAPVPLNNVEKVKLTKQIDGKKIDYVMNRCDDKTIQDVRKSIKQANVEAKKITYDESKTEKKGVVRKRRSASSTASKLTHMIVINFATVTNDHKMIGEIKDIKPAKGTSEDSSEYDK